VSGLHKICRFEPPLDVRVVLHRLIEGEEIGIGVDGAVDLRSRDAKDGVERGKVRDVASALHAVVAEPVGRHESSVEAAHPGQEVLEWRPVFAPSKDGDSERRVSQEPGEWETTLAWESALAEAAAKATESELELDRGLAQERVAAPS
jgi:hypothetical protein